MNKYLSVAELIDSADCAYLVAFSIKKMKLRIPISFEDFLHEVRIKLFKDVKDSLLQKWSHTTIVVCCTTFVYKEMFGAKRSLKEKIENSRLNGVNFESIINKKSSEWVDHVDDCDEVEQILSHPFLDDYSANLLVDRFIMGSTFEEIAQKENTSRENIRQKVNNRLHVVGTSVRPSDLF